MNPEDCVSEQEVLLEPYRAEWTKAQLCNGETDLRTSLLKEVAAYYHVSDSADIDRACDSAVDTLKSEWQETVDPRQRSSIESFYETKTHIYDLMNWHTLRDDSGPLADINNATSFLKPFLSPVLDKLTCPELNGFDQSLFNSFPGYKYSPTGPATNY